MRLLVRVDMLGFAAMSIVAHAASFDCKLAKTPVEKAVCVNAELSKLDDAMAVEYKKVLGDVPTDVQPEVRSNQRAWLSGLPQRCKMSKSAASHTPCLLKEYQTQLKVLQNLTPELGDVKFVMRSITLLSKDAADETGNRDMESNPGFGTLNASWPQSLSDTPEWKAWNAAMLAEVQKMAGGSGTMNSGWQKEWAEGTERDVTSTLETVNAQLVSVGISDDMMGHGAAHPNEAYEQFHWMLKEKRTLKPEDVFKEGSAWEKVIAVRCRADLKKQIGDDYQEYAGDNFAKTLAEIVTQPANWEIDAKGISVDFPEYSVAPRAEPIEPVLIPWSALRELMAPGFVVPR